MITLGIETSCDETAVALFDSSKGLVGEAVFSQIELHSEYGGVIPELASRDHCQKIIHIFQKALGDISSSKIDQIAYTAGPGLLGTLLIGERIEADDVKISNLINKNVKQRRDSIEQFKNGNRDDLVATEEEQLNVILKYLPKQLSEQEIQELIQEGIASVSAKSMQDMGKLMGHLKPKFEGKADMSIVSKLVKELLG